MQKFRGWIAVFVAALLLSIPLYYYWNYLTRGMRPPEATQILNRMEAEGFPDFTLKTLDGRDVSVHDFKGKILLVNIWATWCAPCVKEFPSLKKLVEKFAGKLVVLAVSHDRDRADIDTFVQAFGGLPKDFVIVWDKDRSTAKGLGTDILPETYILSPEQKLLRKIEGEAVWDDLLAVRYFEDVLNPETAKERKTAPRSRPK